jgi:hypothetical protein
MTNKNLNINRLTLGALLFLSFTIIFAAPGSFCAASEAFKVTPVEKPGDLRLLPSTAWSGPESDQGEMLLKLSYLRGLLDALQYVEVAPQSAGRVLKKLNGLDLHQLVAEIDRYYLRDPKRRELPPAAVLFRIIPEKK